MDAGLAVVVAASVSAVGGVLAVLVQGIKRETKIMAAENRGDHEIVQQQLSMVYRAISGVGDKLDKHLETHREGQKNEQTNRGNQG